MRSYSITFVNFKVMYIGRENAVIYTCFVAAFLYCATFSVELRRNEMMQMVDIG